MSLSANVLAVVLNSIWQGALVVLGLALLLRWLKVSAATRYALWYAVLVGMLVLPVAICVQRHVANTEQPVFIVEETYERTVDTPILSPTLADGSQAKVYREVVQAEQVLRQPSGPDAALVAEPVRLTSGRWVQIAGWVWGFGVLLMGGRLLWSVWHIQRLRQTTQPLPKPYAKAFAQRLKPHIGHRLAIRMSDAITVPQVIGVWRPLILVPEALLAQLDEAEWEQVLLHEAAHIVRYDQWTLAGQRLMEVLIWFNPVLWWVSRRLALERELACDAWTVQASGQSKRYASSLTKLVEAIMTAGRPPLMSSALFDRPTLEVRIAHLLRGAVRDSQKMRRVRLSAGMVSLALLGFAVLHLPPLVGIAPAAVESPTMLPIDLPDTPAGRLLQQVLSEEGQAAYHIGKDQPHAIVAYTFQAETGTRLEWQVEAREDEQGQRVYQQVNVMAVAASAQP